MGLADELKDCAVGRPTRILGDARNASLQPEANGKVLAAQRRQPSRANPQLPLRFAGIHPCERAYNRKKAQSSQKSEYSLPPPSFLLFRPRDCEAPIPSPTRFGRIRSDSLGLAMLLTLSDLRSQQLWSDSVGVCRIQRDRLRLFPVSGLRSPVSGLRVAAPAAMRLPLRDVQRVLPRRAFRFPVSKDPIHPNPLRAFVSLCVKPIQFVPTPDPHSFGRIHPDSVGSTQTASPPVPLPSPISDLRFRGFGPTSGLNNFAWIGRIQSDLPKPRLLTLSGLRLRRVPLCGYRSATF